MKLDVEADCLAALIVLDRDLEPTPEPFRMQPEVQLLVNFEEYIKFVSSLPPCRLVYFPTDSIQKAISTHNEQSLVRSFYIDIALAVCKELFFAEYNGKGATIIRHDFYYCQDAKSVRVSGETHWLLRRVLQDRGYDLPQNISARNRTHWDYACKLLQDASGTPTRWVEKS